MTRAAPASVAPADRAQGAPPEVTIAPPPERWPELLSEAARRREESSDAARRAARFREQLGLPVDRPVVMTGHQLAFWHAGILAKFIACSRAGAALGAGAAWLWVDQDEAEFETLRVPVVGPEGERAAEIVRLVDARAAPPPGAPAAALGSFDLVAPAMRAMPDPPSVAAGVARIVETLRAHRAAPNAPRQIAGALAELMAPLVEPAPMVFATALARTDLFASLVSAMAEDPHRAAETYNGAALAHPGAGMTALDAPARSADVELPLWRIRPGRARVRVRASEFGSVPMEELAPRAALLTGLLRLAGADLFIHGVGGGAYDAVTERWFGEWLGETLAPKAVVTATVLLPIDGAGTTEADAARAGWLAHSARHNPGLIGREDDARRKRAAVERIGALRAAGADARAEYAAMHEGLATHRAASAARLAELETESDRARRLLAGAELARDRTWPFPFHDPSALAALADLIGARMRAAR